MENYAKQQINQLKSNTQQQAQNLKRDKLSLEREKRFLAEYKRAVRLFKEIEARSKRGERHQIELKNFKELQNLNNKIIKTEALENEDKLRRESDIRSISMEMAWAQVDGKVSVVFEEMESLIRPERKKELFDKLRYDTALKRDLVGITEVINYVHQRDYNRALASMIYFGIEDRMNEMETFFNVKLGSEFKNKLENIFKLAQEQDLSRFELKDAASENMKFAGNFINETKAAFATLMTGETVTSFDVAVAENISGISVLEIRENKKSVKKNISKLKQEYKFEKDPIKKLETEKKIHELKSKQKQLEAKSLENQSKFLAKAIETKREKAENKTIEIKEKLKIFASFGQPEKQEDNGDKQPKIQASDLDNEIDKIEKEIRTTFAQSKFEEIIEKISRGETKPEVLHALEKLKAQLSDSQIRQYQNRKSLDECLEELGKIDASKPESIKQKQHIANIIVQIIGEKLKNFKFNVSEADVAHYENVLNQIRTFYKKENGGIELSKLDQLIQDKKQNYNKKHEAISENNKSFEEIFAHKADENLTNCIKVYFDKVNTLPNPDKANYTEEEITALENEFSECEKIISEKNLKGDQEFEQSRENARKKVSEMRVRHKIFAIEDTTEIFSIKERDKQIEKLRENLKFLCECIDSGMLDSHNILQIAKLNVEYRKLKALLMTDDNRLKDIEEKLQKVADWEFKTEKNNEKFYSELQSKIDNIKEMLIQALGLINKPNLDESDITLLLACKSKINKLKSAYTVDPRFFKEIDELYEKIEPKIEELEKSHYSKEAKMLIDEADTLLSGEFDATKIKQFNTLKVSYKKWEAFMEAEILIKLSIKIKKIEAKVEKFKAEQVAKKIQDKTQQKDEVEIVDSNSPKVYKVAGNVDADELFKEAKYGEKVVAKHNFAEIQNEQIAK